MSQLSERIELFLRTAFEPADTRTHDEEYQAAFADDGERKAAYICERLKKLEQSGQVATKDMAYLSLGGADGSELVAVLKKTNINFGVLVEMSDAAIAAAEQLFRTLPEGKFAIIQKEDAVLSIDSVFKQIKDRNIPQICLSAQAILHELPDRSAAFKSQNRFLGSLFGHFDRTLFVSREPCKPTNWPEEVEVSIPEVSAERLAEFVKFVGKELRMDFKSVGVIANRSVIGPRDLMVEALHKLIRSDNPASLRYELGEQLTSFDADHTGVLLASYCGSQNRVEIEYTSTDGFRDAYSAAKVFSCDEEKRELPFPNTHARLIAFHTKNSAAPLKKKHL
jgi:hypothetical protein